MHIARNAYNSLKTQLPFNYKMAGKKEGKSVTNAADADTLIIDVDGFIGPDFWKWLEGEEENTIETFKTRLRETSANKIILNLNSPGGDLNHGLVIMEMLQSKKAEVITNLMGFNASAATAIALGGTKRRMSENAFMLIHRSMFGMCGYMNSNTCNAMLEDFQTLDRRLIAMYEKRSKINASDITTLMDAGEGYGKWIDAETALKYGLIDEIYDPADESDPDLDHFESSASTASNRKDDKDKYRNQLTSDITALHEGGSIDKKTYDLMMASLKSTNEATPPNNTKELAKAQMDARKRELQLITINKKS